MKATFTPKEAHLVGKRHKAIMVVAAVYILALLLPKQTPIVSYFWILVPGAIGAIVVYHFAAAQKSPVAWIWALPQFIPVVNVIFIAILHERALRILRDKGLEPGLLGPRSKDLARLLDSDYTPPAEVKKSDDGGEDLIGDEWKGSASDGHDEP